MKCFHCTFLHCKNTERNNTDWTIGFFLSLRKLYRLIGTAPTYLQYHNEEVGMSYVPLEIFLRKHRKNRGKLSPKAIFSNHFPGATLDPTPKRIAFNGYARQERPCSSNIIEKLFEIFKRQRPFRNLFPFPIHGFSIGNQRIGVFRIERRKKISKCRHMILKIHPPFPMIH